MITHQALLTSSGPTELSVVRITGWVTSTAGLVTGGSLLVFSTFVMPALDRLPPADAIRAMNAINAAAPRSLFMLPLMLSALGSAVLGVHAVVRPDQTSRYWMAGGALAGVLAFGITAAYHVPRNDALARHRGDVAQAARVWSDYAGPWTAMNHVRMLLALGSGVALAIGLIRSR